MYLLFYCTVIMSNSLALICAVHEYVNNFCTKDMRYIANFTISGKINYF